LAGNAACTWSCSHSAPDAHRKPERGQGPECHRPRGSASTKCERAWMRIERRVRAAMRSASGDETRASVDTFGRMRAERMCAPRCTLACAAGYASDSVRATSSCGRASALPHAAQPIDIRDIDAAHGRAYTRAQHALPSQATVVDVVNHAATHVIVRDDALTVLSPLVAGRARSAGELQRAAGRGGGRASMAERIRLAVACHPAQTELRRQVGWRQPG
jgi:hypothetical protein